MKKLLALLLCLPLLCSCAPAAYDGPTRTEWVISEFTKESHSLYYDHVDTERTVYSYDIYGNLAQTLFYRNGVQTLKTVFTYDDRGNLLTKEEYNLRGWFPRRNSRAEFTYDDQNRMTSQAFDQSGSYTEIQYLYDDETNTHTQLTGGEVTMVSVYDDSGNQLSCKSITGDSWHLDEYTRDDRGRLLTQHTTNSDGFDQRSRVEYDDHGSTVLWERITNGIRTVTRDEYEYDDRGRPVRQFRLTDTSRMLVCRWEYLDEHGSYTLYDPDGPPNMTVTYDARGNQIGLIHYISGTDQVGIRETTTYIPIQVPTKEGTP